MIVTEQGRDRGSCRCGCPTIVDVTGAGDLFCAGVLFGVATRGRTWWIAQELGALAASEIISHLGARPESSLAELAASSLTSIALGLSVSR